MESQSFKYGGIHGGHFKYIQTTVSSLILVWFWYNLHQNKWITLHFTSSHTNNVPKKITQATFRTKSNMGFLGTQRQVIPKCRSILSEIELLQDFMPVKQHILQNRLCSKAPPWRQGQIKLFQHSRVYVCNSIVISLIWPDFELLWDFTMPALAICKFEENLIMNEDIITERTFSPL